MQFLKLVREKLKVMQISDELLHRTRSTKAFPVARRSATQIVFQMAVLEPQLAILDETDSGLDIDALKHVADGVNALRSPDRAFLMITHYQRLLDYVVPDFSRTCWPGWPHREIGDKSLALEAGRTRLCRPRRGSRGMSQSAPLPLVESLLDASLPASGIAWLDAIRQENREAFAIGGLPDTRVEAWKYTALRALGQRRFTHGDGADALRAVAAIDVLACSRCRRTATGLRQRRIPGRSVRTAPDALPAGLTPQPRCSRHGDDPEPLVRCRLSRPALDR